MCLHCGCGQPHNRHGSQYAITIGDVLKAMGTRAHRAGGKGVGATAEEIRRMILKFGNEQQRRRSE